MPHALNRLLIPYQAVSMRNLPVIDTKSIVRLVFPPAAALIAGLIPASRAASIDPGRVLKAE
jgi:ABC-type lipoprotein release transport system permease subunit